jgi:tryptophan halogenase
MAALEVELESWHDYFPVDRRIVACGSRMASIPPYAEVRMTANGWTALFPTQARTHVMHSYSSSLTDDATALRECSAITRLTLEDASVESISSGCRREAWSRNCVAIGAAACTTDPIHSVGLHVAQLGLVHLLSLFPVSNDYATERVEYNRVCQQAFARVRDFQSAYYASNRIGNSEFWKRARLSRRSSELEHKIDTFRARGELPMYEQETFSADGWQALLIGQGVMPETYDPAVERASPELIKQEFRRILRFIADKVQEQTTHDFYLQAVCSR